MKPGNKILEIGTASGYNTALLSQLTGKQGKVCTLEIIKELCTMAKKNLKNYKNVHVICADGSQGYKKEAPYDRIIVTAAAPRIPKPLQQQLKNNGKLVIPAGNKLEQKMIVATKTNNTITTKSIGDFIFVPLTGKYGFKN